MKIEISGDIFLKYPGYRRAVVVVVGADNRGEDEGLLSELRKAEAAVRENPSMADCRDVPRISSWRSVFQTMKINPNKYPPSVANLIKRTRKGADLPFVNKLVCVFNIISLRHGIPCGGDDLSAVVGDLRLGFATGDETYVPLGQPGVVEHPEKGEVIYFDQGNGDVFCRAWCWKNGDRSKILPETSDVAINLEGMPPVSGEELVSIAEDLSEMVGRHCGGRASVHLLTEDDPILELHR